MPPVLRREWGAVSRSDTFTIVPLADIHIGAAGCDEKAFEAACRRIKEDDTCYWLGLGDYAEFINRNDRRFSVSALADWLRVEHLGDLAKAQRDRFLDFTLPIADKCLGLVGGNHEAAIKRHYERDVFLEIVQAIKQAAGHEPEHRLGLDYCGWMQLVFRVDDKHTRGTLNLYLHHGFVGGKLAGAKALNLERMLWNTDADIILLGHSHNTQVLPATVRRLSTRGTEYFENRIGAYCGSFLQGAEYAEQKGYFAQPTSKVEIVLRPGAAKREDRIRIVTSL